MFDFLLASCFMVSPDGQNIELDFCGQTTEEVRPQNIPTETIILEDIIVFSYTGYTSEGDFYYLILQLKPRDSLINQEWKAGDFVSATLTTENYEAYYTGSCQQCVFKTNNEGEVVYVSIAINSRNNKDTAGGGLIPYIDSQGYFDSRGKLHTWTLDTSPIQNPRAWKFNPY